MKEEYTPVKSCRVGIPCVKGSLTDRMNPELELIPCIFYYTKVSELLVRCAEAGVILLQDPTKLTDATEP